MMETLPLRKEGEEGAEQLVAASGSWIFYSWDEASIDFNAIYLMLLLDFEGSPQTNCRPILFSCVSWQ